MFIIYWFSDETRQISNNIIIIKSEKIACMRWIPDSVNSSTLQLQCGVIDISCKYMHGSLCGWLMTASVHITVSVLCQGNVCAEGER